MCGITWCLFRQRHNLLLTHALTRATLTFDDISKAFSDIGYPRPGLSAILNRVDGKGYSYCAQPPLSVSCRSYDVETIPARRVSFYAG